MVKRALTAAISTVVIALASAIGAGSIALTIRAILLKRLHAGDTIVLETGRDLIGLPVHGVVGAPGKLIIILGPRSQGIDRFIDSLLI